MSNLNRLKKYNKGSKFDFRPADETPYIDISKLDVGRTYPVRAIYINTKGKFGDAGVICTGDFFVNLPTHLTDTIKEMLEDEVIIDLINKGSVAFKTYDYVAEKYNKTCYSIEWIDLGIE